MDKKRVLALDISSSSTGFAWLINEKIPSQKPGVIECSGLTIKERVNCLTSGLISTVVGGPLDIIVIEDTFFSKNVKTLKLLNYLAGVALCVMNEHYPDTPIVFMTVREVRKLLGTKDKKDTFEYIKDRYKLEDYNFKEHNDITDALALALAYTIKDKDK